MACITALQEQHGADDLAKAMTQVVGLEDEKLALLKEKHAAKASGEMDLEAATQFRKRLADKESAVREALEDVQAELADVGNDSY